MPVKRSSRALPKAPRTRDRAGAEQPVFSVLTAGECRTVLGRNHVGRVGFLNDTIVDIEPVSYAATDSWIFIRSAEGTKLEAFAHNPYVAFEVDEIDAPFDWRSVVVHGTVYWMAETTQQVDRLEFRRAVRALRSFMPEALTDADPTPFRRTIYGIHIDRLAGRRAEKDRGASRERRLRFDKPAPRRPTVPSGF
jgi:nitroimidazol reductase NimA-like FMN-containing flavoprotein (pyridoxamine 5'-phosphate oxidase superfamily)